MSIGERMIESESLFRYLFNFGVTQVKKTVKSSFKALGVEELADDFFFNDSS
jgi:hypothetical protein